MEEDLRDKWIKEKWTTILKRGGIRERIEEEGDMRMSI